uniref:Uncharacterized protein n=1 Tax=Romanomermis culicivorax TaxID=13658 RepID=A0A915L705_ROMCU
MCTIDKRTCFAYLGVNLGEKISCLIRDSAMAVSYRMSVMALKILLNMVTIPVFHILVSIGYGMNIVKHAEKLEDVSNAYRHVFLDIKCYNVIKRAVRLGLFPSNPNDLNWFKWERKFSQLAILAGAMTLNRETAPLANYLRGAALNYFGELEARQPPLAD